MNQTQRKLLRGLLALILLLALCTTPALAASYSAKINASDVSIKSASGASGTLPKGTKVTITDISGSWAQISYKGKTGYVQLKYLTLTSGITGYISRDTGLYKGASSSSGKLATLIKGTRPPFSGPTNGPCPNNR